MKMLLARKLCQIFLKETFKISNQIECIINRANMCNFMKTAIGNDNYSNICNTLYD